MKREKSHTRIHQVIMDLREKSKQEEKEVPTDKCREFDRPTTPSSNRRENSDILSLNETESIILPDNYCYHPNSENHSFTSYIGSHESILPQKVENSGLKRVTRTARPVSRRKVSSKEKAQSTKTQKPQESIKDTKKSNTFELLQILDQQHFIIDNNENHTDDIENKEFKTLKAFSSLQHSFVSLFPIEFTECINYDHPNIIPIYGEVTLSDRRFVVSNEYKNSSLRDLISEFGPFEENLCKRYLYQIICGIEEMHSRKTTHNRLFSKNILYNKKGQIFINVVKSTSRPLTEKEKHENLFQYSPETLLTKSKSNSLKNDIWSIGLIFLDMLFDFSSTDLKSIPLHSYNQPQKLSEIDSIIIDNLKQLYPKSFENHKQHENSQKIQEKCNNLSAECKDVIRQCLLLNKDERIDIKTLKSHKFFG